MQSLVRRVALYARLSVTTEESVSIERQLGSARQYAEARGWEVVAEAVDDGVSATKNRPEDRVGWRSLLDSTTSYDAVVVWKVDRLARRVLDFLHADEALRGRDAAIVAVEDPIDMTTAQGRAFATMLAVFAEMEAAALSARVRAARRTLVTAGRRVGGRSPFGFMNIANPDGPGKVLAPDPERISIIEEVARRAMAGESLYALARWLEAQGIRPRARSGRKDANHWHEASVEAMLRAPALAGLTALDGDFVRGEDGLPIVDESVAVLSPAERRSLLAALDGAKRPGTRQKAGHTPALLYGIVRCGSCDGLMYRATAAKKYAQYRCQQKGCPRPVGVSRPGIEAHVEALILAERGGAPLLTSEEAPQAPGVARLAEIEVAIADTAEEMKRDDADDVTLQARLVALKAERRSVRQQSDQVSRSFKVTGQSFEEAWNAEADTEGRRQLLMTQLESLRVHPGGGRGRSFDASRVEPVWRDLGPGAAARQQYRLDVLSMRQWQA